MRWRLGTVLVNVCEDMKIGFFVVVQRVDTPLRVRTAIRRDEFLIGQQNSQIFPNFLATFIPLIGL